MIYASGTLAGETLQASSQSLPAATATCIPCLMRALTASSSAGELNMPGPPSDRLPV